ncbi:hypothetical protein Tco_0153630 [Tanacetum coccineum]
MVGDLVDKSLALIVTLSPSSGTISKHCLISSDSLSSSTFCFLELSCSSFSHALFELFSCAISALAFFELYSCSVSAFLEFSSTNSASILPCFQISTHDVGIKRHYSAVEVTAAKAVSSPMVATAKLIVLNPGEFELWKMRIEQYFLMTYYDLWEVIINGDSPPPKRTVDGVEKTYPPTTVEEKLTRKNELKARTIEKRFGGNKESKKTHKTLLKQQYENFNGSSSEELDQTYDRL